MTTRVVHATRAPSRATLGRGLRSAKQQSATVIIRDKCIRTFACHPEQSEGSQCSCRFTEMLPLAFDACGHRSLFSMTMYDLWRVKAKVLITMFEQDELLQTWFLRHLQIIGEAVRSLPEEARALAPEIPWSKIVGMRNVLVHGYFDIDVEMVWDTATRDVPTLKPAVLYLLQSLEGES